MKILVVSNYYPPHFIGGYEIACRETVDFLKSKNHEVEVITSNYISSKDSSSIQRVLTLTDYNNTNKYKKYFNDFTNYLKVKKIANKFKPDLIYFWSLRGIGLKVINVSNDLNTPKVFEIGDFWMKGFNHAKNMDFSPSICVSDWVGKEMLETYNTKTIKVIKNSSTPPDTEFKKQHINNTLIFGFVGRIDEEKGLLLAIKALNKLTLANFELHVFGNGDQEYIDLCKSESKLGDRLKFKGMVKTHSEIYKNMDILLMPTLMREPFGLVIIEAMFHRVVPVVTDSFGPSEIVNSSFGRKFKRNSIEDLLLVIEELAADPKLIETLSLSSEKEAYKKYLTHNVKGTVENYLKDVVNDFK